MKYKTTIFQLCCLLCVFSLGAAEETYEFVGRHFIANYVDCDEKALTDLEGLTRAMEKAAIASGAHILSSSQHVFPPDGLTMVLLLSESHASIHTYPEHRSCFVDLFTCGHTCDAKKFEAVLEAYLKPGKTISQLFQRDSTPNF